MKLRGGEFSTGTTGNFQPELTLKCKTSYREEKEKPTEKEKNDLTLTGLLMEGLGDNQCGRKQTE